MGILLQSCHAFLILNQFFQFVVQQQPKGSVASSTGAVSSLSSELTETEIFHPSDCSLAPSSNSSCSSSDVRLLFQL